MGDGPDTFVVSAGHTRLFMLGKFIDFIMNLRDVSNASVDCEKMLSRIIQFSNSFLDIPTWKGKHGGSGSGRLLHRAKEDISGRVA